MLDNIILSGLIIFIARTFHITIATLRLMMVTRGRWLQAAFFGFFEAFIFAITITQVAQNLSHIGNLIGYSAGFSAGLLLGSVVERKLLVGFSTMNIVSSYKSHSIAEALRDAGFGATESWGRGSEGDVGIVRTVLRRRELEQVTAIVIQTDPASFVTVEETRTVRRGHMGLIR